VFNFYCLDLKAEFKSTDSCHIIGSNIYGNIMQDVPIL